MPRIVDLPTRARRKSSPGGTGEKYLAALAAAEDTPQTATLSNRAHMAYNPRFHDQVRNLNTRACLIVGADPDRRYR